MYIVVVVVVVVVVVAVVYILCICTVFVSVMNVYIVCMSHGSRFAPDFFPPFLHREYAGAKKKKFKPVVISHHMLAGLKEGQEKMSKSDPDSAIFMEGE